MVEDEPRLRELARRTLADRRHRVTTAASGHEALALLQTRQIALVLSDYAMSDGDGLALLTAARALRPDLPFILWSAALPADVRCRAVELGAEIADAKLVGAKLTSLVAAMLGAGVNASRTAAALRKPVISDPVQASATARPIRPVPAPSPHAA